MQSVIGVNDYFNLILFWSFIYFRSFEGFFFSFYCDRRVEKQQEAGNKII